MADPGYWRRHARETVRFSAGVELGGVSVYLSEMATPGHKGFYVSWQSASQQVAIVAAAALGYWLNVTFAPQEISDFYWRVPFFVGCGKQDFALRAARGLHAGLQKAGVKTATLRLYDDVEHLMVVQLALKDVYAFFDEHLRH